MKETEKLPSRILIVDDNPKNIQLLGTILRENGFRIVVAQNGRKALTAAETAPPNLILLDIMMPEMDGYETCKRLKENPKTQGIPVIFLTAKSETEDIVKGLDLGAVDYITKPFNAVELLSRVRIHIELTEKRRLEGVLEMAGAVCHEMNQPLQSIMGYSELILMGIAPRTPLHDKITKIKEQVAKIGRITQKLMRITRYETKGYLPGKRIIDIEKSAE